MSKMVLAVCDSEEEYLLHLQSYLISDRTFSLEVLVFSDFQECCEYARVQRVDIAVVSELFEIVQDKQQLFGEYILLTEEENSTGICKYRSGEYFVSKIKSVINRKMPETAGKSNYKDMNIIGFYSPVGRCLQTSMAVCMGQLLAKEYRVLFLNFDPYSGWEYMMQYPGEYSSDLAELMYYLKNLDEKFLYQFRSSLLRVNSMDFLPPAMSFADISAVSLGDWEKLLQKIADMQEYQYVILDLSHHVQGVLELLKSCQKIITITKTDNIARAKQAQYEKLIETLKYEDIVEKTRKCDLPIFMNLPQKADRLMSSELGEYVRRILREEVK